MSGKSTSLTMSDLHILLSESLPPFSDKCIFPPSVLEDALSIGSQLPHPLVVSLDSLLVGVKEFTAPSNTVLVPKEIHSKLASETASCSIVSGLAKATLLNLKPLHFYPHITNWKYYLESFLSNSYTTLSKGQTFHYHDTVAAQTVSVLVEDCNAPSVIVVDTDIALDVVPIDDIMGAQQLQHDANMAHLESVSELKEQIVLEIEPFQTSKVPSMFKVALCNSPRYVSVSLESDGDICNVDIIAGLDKLLTLENFYACTMMLDETAESPKKLVVDTHADRVVNYMERHRDEHDCWLYIVPFAWSSAARLTLTMDRYDVESVESPSKNIHGAQCSNCGKTIDPAKIQLHEAFCSRNNIRCSCGKVFSKTIPPTHWHCDYCSVHGNSGTSKFKHTKLVHESPYKCAQCSSTTEYHSFIDLVQKHKNTECPAKLTECVFCHLIVPQEEASYEDRFANLTHHESQCGNRTAECYQCGKVFRNKDMAKHLQMHTIIKQEQNAQVLDICCNKVCTNILAENDKKDNTLGLCSLCYGPLHSTLLDTNNAKLQNRIERKYVLQLTKGCGATWCRNPECSISRGKLGIKEAVTRVQQVLLSAISTPPLPINDGRESESRNRFWFCVNQGIQEKRNYIDSLMDENTYSESLIYKAVNKAGIDGAESWLLENARESA